MEKGKMKNIVCLLLLCFLTACCKHKLMNHEYFVRIPDGTEFKEVTKQFGPPYDMIMLSNGITEYRYIQRTQIAPGVMEHVHFIITVSCEGYIINKKTDTITSTAELSFQ